MSAGPVTVSEASTVVPPYEAEIVTGEGSATLDVSTEKVACVAPACTVTAAGTFATTVLLLVSEILAPPDGAPAARVTVPTGCACPGTVAGEMESLASVADDDSGAAGGDALDATVRLGAAGESLSPQPVDHTANTAAISVKNLRSGTP
jgi:hypothetical protein